MKLTTRTNPNSTFIFIYLALYFLTKATLKCQIHTFTIINKLQGKYDILYLRYSLLLINFQEICIEISNLAGVQNLSQTFQGNSC